MSQQRSGQYSKVVYVQDDDYAFPICSSGDKTMNPISTTLVIVLLVAGLVVGLSFAGIDLLNPWTSNARAERIASETDHQNQLYKLEEQRKQAEYEAYVRQQEILAEQQIQRAAADLAYQQQMNAFKIQMTAAFAELGKIALMLVSALAALGLTSLPFGFAVRLARSVPARPAARAESPFVQPRQSNLWDDPDYRAREIAKARQMELEQHGGKVVQPQQPKPVTMSLAPARHNNGNRRYKDLPLAGD